MPIYNIEHTLKAVKEKPFKLEKDIQPFVEANMTTLLNLQFIKTEFSIGHFRIDSLAFDTEKNAFVIIEYKRDKNLSVIDQGYAYLSLMLNNKADFILEYNEVMSKSLKRSDVDWTQSRVIFISPRFTAYQKEAINFKDLPIELYEIRRYENKTVSFDRIINGNPTESIKTITKQNKAATEVNEEVKVYAEQDHTQKTSDEMREVYAELRQRLLDAGDSVTVYPKKMTIGFKVDNNVFCDIVFLKKELKMYLNLKHGDLEDPKKLTRDVSSTGHWGNGDYQINLTGEEDMDYIMFLVNQVLKSIAAK